MQIPLSIIISICLLLVAFSVWREIARTNKQNLVLRLAAVLIAIAAMACMTLPLTYQKKVALANKDFAVLLTDGYHTDSLAKFGNSTIYTLDASIKKANPQAKFISGINEITNHNPALHNLAILGKGLDEDRLAQLNSTAITFIPTPKKQGIEAINWNTHLKTGEQLVVQGTYINPSGDEVRLILKGLGTGLDSAVVKIEGEQTFELKVKPRNKGRSVYRLLALSGKDTLENESIPLEIFDVKPLNILMLANTPNFEGKFLKQWLATNGYGVAVRSLISKDKYSQEFANIPQQQLNTITAQMLNKFDFVIAGIDVLKTLKPAEAAAVKQEVLQKGLGVIALADSTSRSGFWLQNRFPVSRANSSAQQINTSYKIQGQNRLTSPLAADISYLIPQDDSQPLITDAKGRVTTASTLLGAGRGVFSILSNTYRWMLAGNVKDYTAYWSLLIGKAAKPTLLNSQWVVRTAVPYVNGHTKIQLNTSVNQPQLNINAEQVAAIRQPGLPYAYIADFWPRRAGWQQATQGKEPPQWFFVYPQNEWQNLRNLKLADDTRHYAQSHAPGTSVTKQIQQKVTIAVPKFYFYILMLLACTYLWAEAKFKR